jgi:hypothetical protein
VISPQELIISITNYLKSSNGCAWRLHWFLRMIGNMKLYFGVEFQSRVLNHRWFSSLSYANTSHLWSVWRNLVMRNSEWWEYLSIYSVWSCVANFFCNSNLFYTYLGPEFPWLWKN